MYQKENFEVTIPSKEYLDNSEIIKQIGLTSKSLDGKTTDYWTSSPSYSSADNFYEFRVTADGTYGHSTISETYGVRPIIKAANLKEIIKNNPMHLYQKGLKMIVFGKWYSPKGISVSKITEAEGKIYQPSPFELAPEIISGEKEYASVTGELHPVMPIKWYYDEESDLLLSEKVLMFAKLNDSETYNGNFTSSSLYKNLNDYFLKSLLDNINQENLPEEQEELLKQIRKLIKENEDLKEENERLKSELATSQAKTYTKVPSKLEILGQK